MTRVSGSKIRPKLEAIAGTLEKLTSLLTPSKGATVLEGHPDREYFYLRPGHGDDPGKNAAILSVFHYLDHRDPNVDAYAEYRGLPKPEAYQEVLSLLGKLGDAAGKALLQLPRTDADRTSDNKRDDTILMVAIVYEASGGTVHTHAIDGSDIDEVGPDDSLKGSRSSHFLDCLWEINRCLPDGAKLALLP